MPTMNESILLSQAAYAGDNPQNMKLPPNWCYVKTFPGGDSNATFRDYGVALAKIDKNGKFIEGAYVSRGSNIPPDWMGPDIGIANNVVPDERVKDAAKNLESMMHDPMFKDAKMVVIGHSLGGEIIKPLTGLYNVDGVSVNGPGTSKFSSERVIQINTNTDVVGNVGLGGENHVVIDPGVYDGIGGKMLKEPDKALALLTGALVDSHQVVRLQKTLTDALAKNGTPDPDISTLIHDPDSAAAKDLAKALEATGNPRNTLKLGGRQLVGDDVVTGVPTLRIGATDTLPANIGSRTQQAGGLYISFDVNLPEVVRRLIHFADGTTINLLHGEVDAAGKPVGKGLIFGVDKEGKPGKVDVVEPDKKNDDDGEEPDDDSEQPDGGEEPDDGNDANDDDDTGDAGKSGDAGKADTSGDAGAAGAGAGAAVGSGAAGAAAGAAVGSGAAVAAADAGAGAGAGAAVGAGAGAAAGADAGDDAGAGDDADACGEAVAQTEAVPSARIEAVASSTPGPMHILPVHRTTPPTGPTTPSPISQSRIDTMEKIEQLKTAIRQLNGSGIASSGELTGAFELFTRLPQTLSAFYARMVETGEFADISVLSMMYGKWIKSTETPQTGDLVLVQGPFSAQGKCWGILISHAGEHDNEVMLVTKDLRASHSHDVPLSFFGGWRPSMESVMLDSTPEGRFWGPLMSRFRHFLGGMKHAQPWEESFLRALFEDRGPVPATIADLAQSQGNLMQPWNDDKLPPVGSLVLGKKPFHLGVMMSNGYIFGMANSDANRGLLGHHSIDEFEPASSWTPATAAKTAAAPRL